MGVGEDPNFHLRALGFGLLEAVEVDEPGQSSFHVQEVHGGAI